MNKIKGSFIVKMIAWVVLVVSTCMFLFSVVGIFWMESNGFFSEKYDDIRKNMHEDVSGQYSSIVMMNYQNGESDKTKEYFADKSFRYGIIEDKNWDDKKLNSAHIYLERNFTKTVNADDLYKSQWTLGDDTYIELVDNGLLGSYQYYMNRNGKTYYADRICYDTKGGVFYYRADGRYYPVDSLIHRLDPRTKLFGTMVFILSLFVANNIWGYLLGTIALAAVIVLTKVPVRFILKGLKAIVILLLISVSFNLFLTPGRELVRFWIFKITWEGIRLAGFMAVRLIYLVVGSSLMTLTTTPNQLTDGLEKGLGFLKRFHVPVHEISMMMSIALRFIPILVEETDKIMKAQMARGADFESGNLVQKAKAMIPLLVPLFISAFRRATDLAMAMEARCYRGGEGRTKMKPLQYSQKDYEAYMVFALYFVLIIASRVYL